MLGLAVHGQAIGAGFAADDWAQMAMVDGDFAVSRPAWSLFDFASGDVAEIRRLRARGQLPWWSVDDLRLSLLRPLSSWLMSVDRRLFDDAPLPPHLHSALWWLGLCAAVAWLLRALLPARVALLALGLYVLDAAHTLPLGWLANRNSLVASLFAVLSLRFYLDFVRGGGRREAIASALLLSLALCGGEYALTYLGYFAALAVMHPADGEVRPARLWPAALPAVAYLSVRAALGFGTRASGTAVEPFDRPLDFAYLLPERAGALWMDAMLSVPAELSPNAGAWLHAALGQAPDSLDRPQRVVSIGGLLVCLGLLSWLVRLGGDLLAGGRRDAAAIALAALWSTVPVCATLPSTRHLLSAQLGVAALVAATLLAIPGQLRPLRPRPGRLRRGVCWGLAALLLSCHLVVSPVVANRTAAFLVDYTRSSRDALLSLGGASGRSGQRVYLLQAWDPTYLLYGVSLRTHHGRPLPLAIHTLNGSPRPLVVEREGPRTLRLSHPGQRPMLGGEFEALFRRTDLPISPGRLSQVPSMAVEAAAVVDGRATALRFVFAVDIEGPDVLWLRQRGGSLEPVALPAVGATAQIDPAR